MNVETLKVLLTNNVYWLLILPIVYVFYVYKQRSNKKQIGPRPGIDRSSTYPRQYAVGWYNLCESTDVPRGAVKHFYILGREMVAFRSDDGNEEVSVVEA